MLYSSPAYWAVYSVHIATHLLDFLVTTMKFSVSNKRDTWPRVAPLSTWRKQIALVLNCIDVVRCDYSSSSHWKECQGGGGGTSFVEVLAITCMNSNLFEFLEESIHDSVSGLNTSRDQLGRHVWHCHHTNQTAEDNEQINFTLLFAWRKFLWEKLTLTQRAEA